MNITTILKDDKTFLHSNSLIYLTIGIIIIIFFIILCKIKCLKKNEEKKTLIKTLKKINSSPAILEHNKEIERAEENLYTRLV